MIFPFAVWEVSTSVTCRRLEQKMATTCIGHIGMFFFLLGCQFDVDYFSFHCWIWSVFNLLLVSTLFLQPITPLEPCEWLNKLFMEVWFNFFEPKLAKRFRSIVEVSFLHVKKIPVFSIIILIIVLDFFTTIVVEVDDKFNQIL